MIKLPYISRRHCTVTRQYDGIRVHDESKNGTFVEHRRALEEEREVRPGGTFKAGGITFLALNAVMYEVFPTLSEILDWEDGAAFSPHEVNWPTPSGVIMWGSGTDHLLVTGPRGCGHDRLAEAVHRISLVRDREIVKIDAVPPERAAQRDLLMRAQKSTLVFTVGDDTPELDAAFASMLFSPSYRIRVIVCAPSADRAASVLGREHAAMRRIELRPLAFRTDQLGRLLDDLFAKAGSPLRFEKLTKANQQALLACDWRRNLDELHTAAERLAAILAAGSLRQAAVALKIKNFNVLQKWFTDTMKLSLPLLGGR